MRIRRILDWIRSHRVTGIRVLWTATLCAISFAVFGAASPFRQQDESLKFLVVSIRPIPPGTLIRAQALGIACRGSDGFRQATTAVKPQTDPIIVTPQGRCSANGVLLQSVIGFAFGIPTNSVLGGPDWVRDAGRVSFDPDGFAFREAEAFQIETLADEPATVTIKQLRQMLQTMLAERFRLAYHRETKNVKGYALVVAERGTKLNEVLEGYESPRAVFDENLQRIIKGTSQLNELAMLLLPGVAVADKTGLMGVYNYQFRAPLPPPPPPPPPGTGAAGPGEPGGNGGLQPPSDTASTLSAFLEDHLGLRLKADTVSVDAFAIDHVERPSPN